MSAPDASSWHVDLVEAAPDAMLVVDAQGHIVFANRRTEVVLGWPPAELLGRSVETLVPARVRGLHVVERRSYAIAPRTREMGAGRELYACRRDGREIPVEISLCPMERDGAPVICCIVRDVSRRKQDEAQARRLSLHLQSAVESIQGAFALFDADDRLVLCNSTYRELFARELAGPLVGQCYDAVLDAAIAAGVFVHEGETPAEFRARCMRSHREHGAPIDVRTIEGHCVRMIDRPTPEGGTVSEVWDLTADVLREAELRRAQELAAAASAAKSEFLSSMSHELRTPLNAVLGFAQLLGRDKRIPLHPRHKDMLGHVVQGGEQLLRLIEQILDFSRIEAGDAASALGTMSLAQVLDDVREALTPAATRAGITVELGTIDAAVDVVHADRTYLTRILTAYVDNAIKYGRAGGSVVLETQPRRAGVRVTVTDDGIGIAADLQHRVFEPFQRAGRESGPIHGAGLGLAISRRLAELMGARVGFSSTPGRGSSFWLELPRGDAPAHGAGAARAGEP